MKYIKIKKDLFNISNRLKKIDKTYFVLFNTFTKNYEVHSLHQKGCSMCFVVGKVLDCYALKKAIQTSVKFATKNIKDMLNQNKKLSDKEQNNLIEKSKQQLNEYLFYFQSFSKDIDYNKTNTTKWY